MRRKREWQGKSKMVNARPHPGRLPSVFAALRRDRAEAKGEGGQEKENRSPRFRNVVRRRLQERRRATRRWTTAVPSPWGEGQGEGGRETNQCAGRDLQFRAATVCAAPVAAMYEACHWKMERACCGWSSTQPRSRTATCRSLQRA